MPPVTTRTFNPLPFEHLEPKRFEDLARQLAYDFRPWRQLEATGRAGSDDGFDARGFEAVPTISTSEEPDDLDNDGVNDRLWLIQCKREHVIGPSKMMAYLDDMPETSYQNLHGLLFVAACNFSKKTRDTLRTWCAEKRISECHIWGRAELEDLLYQPKNDNLLFAYFGISLQIRRQKAAANIRRATAIKRKIKRIIENNTSFPGPMVIFRDPSDDRYPYMAGKTLKEGKSLWRVLKIEGLGIFGIKVLVFEFFAYLDRGLNQWDVATGHNLANPPDREKIWPYDEENEQSKKIENAGRHFWLSIPGNKNYKAKFIAEVHYEDIMEIDDLANDDIKLTTVYVTFKNGKIPFGTQHRPLISGSASWEADTIIDDTIKHIRAFPDEARDSKFDERWQKAEGFELAKERTEITLEPPAWIAEFERMENSPIAVPTE